MFQKRTSRQRMSVEQTFLMRLPYASNH